MFTEITINCHYKTGHIVEVVFISKVVIIPGGSWRITFSKICSMKHEYSNITLLLCFAFIIQREEKTVNYLCMLTIAYFSICLTHFAILFLQPGKNRINFSNSVKFTVLIGNTHLKKQCHCFYLISRVYFTVHSYVHVFKLFFAFFIVKIPK